MNILGPDNLVFGVDDVEAASAYAEDYGLIRQEGGVHGAVYEAMDGTCITILRGDDPTLPRAVAPTPNLREAIYGVADVATLEAIAAELSTDRDVRRTPDGVLHTVDADGYPIGFQVTVRRPLPRLNIGVNCPGQPVGRDPNILGAIDDARPRPVSLSHFVVFTMDRYKSEAFYRDRLGFRTVDVFDNAGPFMRPAGTMDHHTLFLVQADTLGLQHFTFHFAGPNELLKAGFEFTRKGYKSPWGPGRHILGSNYFWYFNSPFGGMMEMDADMDLHDDSWVPRHMDASADTSQTFLLQFRDKWSRRGARKVPVEEVAG